MGYSIGPRKERVLRLYWKQLFMVARSRNYCVTPFKIHRGVNNGDPLSLTIFIMVVDTVIHHWVILVTGEEEGPEGFR